MYKVVNWDTEEIISEHNDIKKARRACRALGAIQLEEWANEYCKTLPPVARVKDHHGFCVYNPRFKNPDYNGS